MIQQKQGIILITCLFFEGRSELKLLQLKEHQIKILFTTYLAWKKNWGQEPFPNCFKSLVNFQRS